MDDKQFQKYIDQATELTPVQFKLLVQAYAGHSGQDAGRVWSGCVYAISEQHLTALLNEKVKVILLYVLTSSARL